MKQGGKRRSKAAQKALNDTVNLKPLGIGSIKRTPKFVGDPAAESTIEYTVSEILAEGTRKGKPFFEVSECSNAAMFIKYVVCHVVSNCLVKCRYQVDRWRECRNRVDRHWGKS